MFFNMPTKNPTKKVTKRRAKSVGQKLELIRKLESGKTVSKVFEEYGVKRQTVSDIRKQKSKLEAYVTKFGVAGKSDEGRKHMKLRKIVDLDAAVYKWYVH